MPLKIAVDSYFAALLIFVRIMYESVQKCSESAKAMSRAFDMQGRTARSTHCGSTSCGRLDKTCRQDVPLRLMSAAKAHDINQPIKQ